MRYLIIFLFLVLSACASTSVRVFDTPEDQYEYARGLYDQEKFGSAVEAFQTVIFRFHGTSLADSVTYYMGMCYYNMKDYILAIGEFKRLQINYPSSPLADDADYMVSYCYFFDAPRSIGLEQDGIKDAIRSIQNFFEDFPDSPYRDNARRLLDSCYARQAHKDYKNGDVYYRIGDYRAARIYLEDLVIKHQETSPGWVSKALFRLAQIDFRENKYEDSKAKYTNFLNTFPEHEWHSKAVKNLEKVEAKLLEVGTSEPEENPEESANN